MQSVIHAGVMPTSALLCGAGDLTNDFLHCFENSASAKSAKARIERQGNSAFPGKSQPMRKLRFSQYARNQLTLSALMERVHLSRGFYKTGSTIRGGRQSMISFQML
jgi:hypothetical protein